MSPLSIKRNRQPFFIRYWSGTSTGKTQNSNLSLTLLRYNSHTFIDATFKIIPRPFFQCVIVMTYDCGTEL
ncbi:hypothetical protein HZS_1461 [Henneguya salminicola]|nr:hypothetical protein HZS_1461 [Henneguya salminicola]